MGSDIFESYCGAQIATVAIASAAAATGANALAKLGFEGENGTLLAMQLPLLLTTVGLVCSFLGVLVVRLLCSRDPSQALRFGTIGAAILFIISAFGLVGMMGLKSNLAICVLLGAVGGIIIGLITEYYTAGKPIRELARQGETGVATIMIAGLSLGMKSVAIPLLSLAAVIFFSFEFAELYGVGLAAVGMLGTVGITMAIDCLLYTSPSPRDLSTSRMPSSA